MTPSRFARALRVQCPRHARGYPSAPCFTDPAPMVCAARLAKADKEGN